MIKSFYFISSACFMFGFEIHNVSRFYFRRLSTEFTKICEWKLKTGVEGVFGLCHLADEASLLEV